MEKAASAVPADRRDAFAAAGGLAGNVDYTKLLFRDVRSAMRPQLEFLRLRLGAYSDRSFSEQRLRLRLVKDDIAVRMVIAQEEMAAEMRAAAERGGTVEREMASERRRVGHRVNRRGLGPGKRRRRKRQGNRRRKRSGRKRGANKRLKTEAGKRQCQQQPAGAPKLAEFTVAFGDWNGARPKGLRADSSFPRMDLQRRNVKALHNMIKQRRFERTLVVLRPARVSEYRTTANCPELPHRILNLRVDRRGATKADARNLRADSPSWKVLRCAACRACQPRDFTSAFAIATNAEQAWLVENCGAFQSVPAVAEGYRCRH